MFVSEIELMNADAEDSYANTKKLVVEWYTVYLYYIISNLG